MENKQISDDISLFHQAITNPLSLSEADLLSLLVKFPYVQSLRFAYERHLYLLNKELHNISSTLLYAANPNWLYEYLHKAVPVDVVSVEDSIQVIEEAVDVAQMELDKLIETAVAPDFFRLESSEAILEEVSDRSDVMEATKLEIEGGSSRQEERVSVYDDELMPYSFLWWLHKTRLEHADTYQPFLKEPISPSNFASKHVAEMHQTIDAQLLDQQIRENIFHFQPPEVKLSDAFKNPGPTQVEKKSTDQLIERFIKEEPQIKPPQADKINLENKARKSSEDQYSLVTETLARIYIEQGLYPKAIEVYKKLVLKYPEKNAYFASEILNLEKKLT